MEEAMSGWEGGQSRLRSQLGLQELLDHICIGDHGIIGAGAGDHGLIHLEVGDLIRGNLFNYTGQVGDLLRAEVGGEIVLELLDQGGYLDEIGRLKQFDQDQFQDLVLAIHTVPAAKDLTT